MNTLLKNGTLVTASETLAGDILIDRRKISRIGANLNAGSSDRVIDVTGKS